MGKKYYTPLAEFRPELQPNGRIVECIEDNGNGFIIVKCDCEIEPNIWLIKEDMLKEVV